MGVTWRGRPPGPVGRRPDRGAAGPGRGPLGHGGVLLAEAETTEHAGTATDATATLPIVELDEPRPVTMQPAALEDFDLPLFRDVPAAADVEQGAINNCTVAAFLIGLANASQETAAQLIAEYHAEVHARAPAAAPGEYALRPRHCYEVRLRGAAPVYVSSLLYVTGGGIAYTHAPDNLLGWMCYAEKAYVRQFAGNNYDRLNAGGPSLTPALTTNRIFCDLAGGHYDFYDLATNIRYTDDVEAGTFNDSRLMRVLESASAQVTVAASKPSGIPLTTVAVNHAYAVLGVRRAHVQLRDPRGGSDAEQTLALADFRACFQAVLQASAST